MRLVKGSGSPTDGACWMSALHFYTRQDSSWSDGAPWACVSPVVRALCIKLNDWCDDGEREALIGPHLFAPLGTKTTKGDETERRRLLVAWVCEQARSVLHIFEARFPNDDRPRKAIEAAESGNANAAAYAANAAANAYAAAYAANAAAAAYANAAAAAYAAYADAAYADAAYADAAAADAYADAAYAAAYAANAAAYDADADARRVDRAARKRSLLDLILRCCAVGERQEVASVCSQEAVLEMLCK